MFRELLDSIVYCQQLSLSMLAVGFFWISQQVLLGEEGIFGDEIQFKIFI